MVLRIGKKACLCQCDSWLVEDPSIAAWAASAFVAGGTELFLPKQFEVDSDRLAAARVLQCSRWRWRPLGHFPEPWIPSRLKTVGARRAPAASKGVEIAEAGKLPAAPGRRPLVGASLAGASPPSAPSPPQIQSGPMSGVQALAAKFGGAGPPAQAGESLFLYGLLPPLGETVSATLPPPPVGKASAGDKKSKPDKDKASETRKSKQKMAVNELLLNRALGRDDDSSNGSSSSSANSAQQKKLIKKRKKAAKNSSKNKRRHRKDLSVSSDDMSGELFRDAATKGSLVNKIQRVAQESPGALLDSGLKAMRRFLDPRAHQGSGDKKEALTPHVTQYLTTVVQALRGKELGLRSERELRTLSEALDHLLSGNFAACGDTLMQRFKAVELSGESGWSIASRMELIPQSAASAVPTEEREAALTLEGRERKLLGISQSVKKPPKP